MAMQTFSPLGVVRGFITEEGGWTMALNDGEGTFETVRTEEIGYGLIEVLGGDLTGDGKDEIVMSRRTEVPKVATEVVTRDRGLVYRAGPPTGDAHRDR